MQCISIPSLTFTKNINRPATKLKQDAQSCRLSGKQINLKRKCITLKEQQIDGLKYKYYNILIVILFIFNQTICRRRIEEIQHIPITEKNQTQRNSHKQQIAILPPEVPKSTNRESKQATFRTKMKEPTNRTKREIKRCRITCGNG